VWIIIGVASKIVFKWVKIRVFHQALWPLSRNKLDYFETGYGVEYAP
jgi:membrane-bound metal-dependent hydrolase YbcI (DUF457 family)